LSKPATEKEQVTYGHWKWIHSVCSK